MNGESVEEIVEDSFVAATQTGVQPTGIASEYSPQNAAVLLDDARKFYAENNDLPDMHSFVLYSVKYIFPLLRGIQRLIVSPDSEVAIRRLLKRRGISFALLESSKQAFVRFAYDKKPKDAKDFKPEFLLDDIIGALDDWFTGDFSPDMKHIGWLGEFLHRLASPKDKKYY